MTIDPSPGSAGGADRPATNPNPLGPGGYWLPLALVILIVLALFYPVSRYSYSLIDDASNVYSNRFICHLGAQNIGYLWRHPYYELYMPVTDTVWGLLARVSPLKTPIVVTKGGEPTFLNPAVFHTANLLLHLATTAFVFGILKRLGYRPWGCAAGSLIFGVHPLQTESVAWITGMNNLTGGFFGFLSLLLYLTVASQQGDRTKRSTGQAVLLTLATFVFAIALLSKPICTILPLFIIVLEVMVLKRPLRRWAGLVAVWLCLSLICTIVTQAASGRDSSGSYSPFWGRPFIAGDALAFYMGKVLFPSEITFDYTRNPYQVLHHWWGYVTWILPVGAFCTLAFIGKKGSLLRDDRFTFRRTVLAAFLIFVAGVLPTIGLVPYYSEAISTVSDRFLYLAMLGPALAAAAIVSQPLPSSKRIVAAIPVVLLAALIYRSSLAVPIWQNMYSLTNDMLDSSPRSAIAHQCYGLILCKRDAWNEALAEFRTAEHLQYVVSSSVDDSIGQCLYHLGRTDDAIAHYKESIRLQPDDNDAWFQLWLIWSKRAQLREAEEYVRARIAKYPDDDRAKFTLGLVLMQQNRPADALPFVELAAKSDPENSDSQFYVGVIYQKLGRFAEATAAYNKALELDPENADAAKGLASLPRLSGTP